MCGIFAAQSSKYVNDILDYAIRALEYRGYDSWGFWSPSQVLKSTTRYNSQIIQASPTTKGVVHTRWATTGKVWEGAAHPIVIDGWSICHNGILPNFKDIDKSLGFTNESGIDTETILRYILKYNLLSIDDLPGDFSCIITNPQNEIYGYRQGSTPLYLVEQEDNRYFTSDLTACPPGHIVSWLLKPQVIYSINIKLPQEGIPSEILPRHLYSGKASRTLHEIWELETLYPNLKDNAPKIDWGKETVFVGSGSSYNAAVFASKVIGGRAVVPIDYESGNPLFISQSGESFDILEAAKKAYRKQPTACLTNNPQSRLAQLCDTVLTLNCGREEGVAATKTFMAQIAFAYNQVWTLPRVDFDKIRLNEEKIKSVALKLIESGSTFLMGSGMHYPIALEGALKLKELGLIFAEGMQTTEFKHGPLALVKRGLPIIILHGGEKEEILAEQIDARGGRVIMVGSGYELDVDNVFEMTIVLQLLAYYTTIFQGLNPDYPPNIAKAITVA